MIDLIGFAHTPFTRAPGADLTLVVRRRSGEVVVRGPSVFAGYYKAQVGGCLRCTWLGRIFPRPSAPLQPERCSEARIRTEPGPAASLFPCLSTLDGRGAGPVLN